ncbi:MAG TPA: FapA family protein [Oscillospiraceae bacterium]|nr:FapA family protein [Oscillospiraceae bacterium]
MENELDVDVGQENKDLEHDPIDGKFELNVNASFSEATLIVHPPYFGGKPVTEEQILTALAEKGVVYGIDTDEIKTILSEERYGSPFRIAKWLPPKDGIDGTITYHFEHQVEHKPKEDARGFVDYRDLGYIRNIKAGTVIATITPPTDGEPGIDLRGHTVNQRKGKPANAAHGENIGLSGDGSQLIALADGNLKSVGGKFAIETVFNLRGNVDASIGNLDFIGDIIIRGEVLEGFKITSQKSVTVYENVMGATIEAGGNVTIKKGCINSRVVSHGNVTIDFVENSNITCDGDLKADAFVTSTVYCGGELTAQGRMGTLMGGRYTCLKNLTANTIGTKSYLPTNIIVGDNAIMLEEKSEALKRLSELENQILRCSQVVDFLTQKKKQLGKIPPEREDMLNAAIKQKLINQAEKAKLQARIKEIEKYLENKQNLSVTCKKELYPGTKIIINDLVFQANATYQYCKIYLGEEGIQVETL